MARHDYDLPDDYEKRVEEGTMSEWYTKERVKRQMMRQKLPHTRRVRSALDRIKRKSKARSVKRKLAVMKDAANATYESKKISMENAVQTLLDYNDVDHEYDAEDLKPEPETEDEPVSKRQRVKNFISNLVP